jgi:hypothetical protein
MSNRNRRGSVGWDSLLVLSLVGALLASWFVFAQPTPHPVPRTPPGSSLKEIDDSTRSLENAAFLGEEAIQARTWNLSAETLASEVLSRLTHLAETHHLQVSRFRSGKVISAPGLQEVPFVVVFEGAFMDVMAAVEDLERPESKVAVSQLSIASRSEPGQVTATLALTGFLAKEVK